ncbi:MFS transporter [Egicoccus sp. AB-alg2]|uniref:MFS transporter n=1 Tax=Egicoccus sp. AB-alg2 TaxID=3242693 RepID=UPI00359D5589
MQLFVYVRERDWVPVVGYLFYVAAMAAGYYYNLTFVQLGLVDLGTRLIGMTRQDVSMVMAVLALVTLAVALAAGVVMDRRGWGADLHVKIRLLLAVLTVQLALTVVAPSISSAAGLLVWVLVCSLPLGVGIPVMFSTMVDFVPVRDRGYVAAVVAGLSFFLAALYPFEWRIEEFAVVVSAAMAPAVVVLAVLSWRRFAFLDALAGQHRRFGTGRYCRPRPVRTASLTFFGLVAVMFLVFFIDSLGFLRIIETPTIMAASWQSPDVGVRLFIAVSHVVGALAAGVLYTNFGRRWLLLWIVGLFAFTHLLATFGLRVSGDAPPPLTMPLFYVLAVSFYTTVNFALWPDHATPATIGVRTAIGVGVAGWLASFLSTALALYSEAAGVTLLDHLVHVNALALLALFTLPAVFYVRRMAVLARQGAP